MKPRGARRVLASLWDGPSRAHPCLAEREGFEPSVRGYRTPDFESGTFDHSATAFPLAGKHAGVTCRECHKETNSGINGRQFQKVSARCESCHPDIHQRQFETDGATQCDRCHRPDGWRELTFSHESQSKFSLTGAHKKVRCDACHKLERTATASFVRFKPVATACVSCHQQGGVQ